LFYAIGPREVIYENRDEVPEYLRVNGNSSPCPECYNKKMTGEIRR